MENIKGKILVLDDEQNITFVLQTILERTGFEVLAFNDPRKAKEAILKEKFHAVITDLNMPHMSGFEFLQQVHKIQSHLPVVVLTAFGTVDNAVLAMKQGAFDFLTKPFDQDEVTQVIQKAVATYRQTEIEPSSFVGTSSQIKEIYRLVGKVAKSPSTVLISGESGTGKELVAAEIVRQSNRSDKPYVKVNCAAIPANLIESELFGHEKGAFTGAVASRPGRFELANHGTLFLDEIGEMSLETQVKLLRVLQEHEFQRVGGVQTLRVDVRMITATNRNLEEEVRAGRFREDLFYRLNVVPIHIPPLRERKEDIEVLVGVFIKKFNEKLGRKVSEIDPDGMDVLLQYNWPGNIRQLENAVERMVLMTEGEVISVADMPSEIVDAVPRASGSGISFGESVLDATSFKEIVKLKTQTVERELIEKALDECEGNVTRTAEKLGISRKGLQIKIKELGIKK